MKKKFQQKRKRNNESNLVDAKTQQGVNKKTSKVYLPVSPTRLHDIKSDRDDIDEEVEDEETLRE